MMIVIKCKPNVRYNRIIMVMIIICGWWVARAISTTVTTTTHHTNDSHTTTITTNWMDKRKYKMKIFSGEALLLRHHQLLLHSTSSLPISNTWTAGRVTSAGQRGPRPKLHSIPGTGQCRHQICLSSRHTSICLRGVCQVCCERNRAGGLETRNETERKNTIITRDQDHTHGRSQEQQQQ